jgi:hypothetical protein
MMMRRATGLLSAVLCVWAWAVPASADPWNERTVLKFDAPVMVPGATLQPGTYVFQIADATHARHTIRITRENDSRVITTAQAVPMHRQDATNDIVIKFNPTERSAAPAVKGWFYPGREYGHEFIYPEEQARAIASRTHTLVLADDAKATDMSGTGTLHVIDAQGARTDWKPDEALNREWDAWSRSRQNSAAASSNTTGSAPAASSSAQAPTASAPSASSTSSAASTTADRSSAALIKADRKGMRVTLDELENNPNRYIGKQVSVDGEVDTIVGPRLFKLDEPGWADLEGEMLVVLPAGTGAALKENDQVTVSGTVRQFVRADVERDWGWLNDTPEVELKLARKPVLVADRIIGTNDKETMIIRAPQQNSAVATSGKSAAAGIGASAHPAISDPVALASGDDDLGGRPVHLDAVEVTGVDAGHGFFIGPRERQLFVLTQYAGNKASVATGQKVSVDGFVMQMPSGTVSHLTAPGALNRHIYVYATELD